MNAAPAVLPVSIPTPEEAGVASPDSVDWAATRRQLRTLGAVGFGLKPNADRAKFFIDLPGGRRAEGDGLTEAEAVASALASARRLR